MATKGPDQTDSSAVAWQKWFTGAMARARMGPADLVRLTEGTEIELKYPTINKWVGGKGGADPDRVIVVAQLLNEDVASALRAAGHHLIANQIAAHADRQSSGREIRGGSLPDDPLAALRASDLPEHLKRKFEDEYAALLRPLDQAIDAARRRFAAEVDDALDAQQRRDEQGLERGAETA